MLFSVLRGCWQRMVSHTKILTGLLIIASVVYPFCVYFLSSSVGNNVWIIAAGGLLLARAHVTQKISKNTSAFYLVMIIALLLCAAVAPHTATKLYPVAISLSLASAFALSLIYPPTIIERIARLQTPNLPDRAITYTRNVTCVWIGVLVLNAVISGLTAFYATPEGWLLWNGFLSYMMIGGVFALEFLVRQHVKTRGT